jgi:heme/copper-type cytochrome/quinol oxidase subunit 2
MAIGGAGVCSPAVSTLSWIALVAALVLIVPAAIRIAIVLVPRSADGPDDGRARALDTIWTIIPLGLLAVLIAFSVAAA